MRKALIAILIMLFGTLMFPLPMASASTQYCARVVAAYDEEFECKSRYE